jgi:predicted nucleotidyltransferase
VSLDERLVAEIVGRIRSVATPRRILIFGSAAVGAMTPDSDIDLLVLEDRVADARADRLRIRQALRGLGWAFDVVVMTTERFDETKGVVGTIAYPANRQSHVVYEAA